MKKIIALFLVTMSLLSFCGCAALIVGGAVGALGGYAASKDTIQGNSDKAYDDLWIAATDVARSYGNVDQEDKIRGYIEAESGTSKVYIRLARLTRATTRIRVSARKHHLPDLNRAEDLFVKIMDTAK